MREGPQVIRQEADAVLLRDFDIAPVTPKLVLHDTASWERYKQRNNYRSKSEYTLLGQYLVREQEAHVWMDNPSSTWVSTLYHELHGHGLFYTRSSLATVCAKTANDAALPMRGWGLPTTVFNNSEGFATWMEWYLCNATGRERTIARVEENMPPHYRVAYEKAKDLGRELSPPGFLRQMGIPIEIDKMRAGEIVRAASANRRVDLALLVSTPGPGDPVRVIVVSDDRPSIREQPWLQPRVMDGERFITEVVARDATLTAQIKNAQLLYGDSWAFEKAKARLVNGTLPSSGYRSRSAYAPWP